MRFFIFLSILLVGLSSCSKDDDGISLNEVSCYENCHYNGYGDKLNNPIDPCGLNPSIFIVNAQSDDFTICFDREIVEVSDLYHEDPEAQYYYEVVSKIVDIENDCVTFSLKDVPFDWVQENGFMINVKIKTDCDSPQEGDPGGGGI